MAVLMHAAIRFLLPALALALAVSAQSPFAWKDAGGRMELREQGRDALVYNYGPQLREGAPENMRRCCYVFPLWSPAGASVLDDFPAGELHHRGLFWGWEFIETGGQTYDLWKNLTVQLRATARPVVSATAREAALSVQNIWQAGGRDIVHEELQLTVYPTREGAREFQVQLTWEAIGAPVTLRATTAAGKSYGGLVAHFAPADQRVIRADGQVVSKDEDLNRHRSVEVEAVYAGKPVTVRITPDEHDPGLPYQWILRTRGFAGASFPGRSEAGDSYTLEAGKRLTLSFLVRVADVR
jgi:Methane oxygenase PmoA